MNIRQVLMGIGLVIASGLALFGDKQPAGVVEVASPRARTSRDVHQDSPPLERKPVDAGRAIAVQALKQRGPAHENGKADSANEAMFQPRSWAPPPQPTVASEHAEQAPPLTLTYLGLLENGKAQIDKVLLADGDKTLVVGVDDQIGDQYKVRSITRQAIVLEYLPLRQQQTLPIQ